MGAGWKASLATGEPMADRLRGLGACCAQAAAFVGVPRPTEVLSPLRRREPKAFAAWHPCVVWQSFVHAVHLMCVPSPLPEAFSARSIPPHARQAHPGPAAATACRSHHPMSGGAPVSARSMKRTKAGVSGGAAARGEAARADERELLGRPGRGWSAFSAAGAAAGGPAGALAHGGRLPEPPRQEQGRASARQPPPRLQPLRLRLRPLRAPTAPAAGAGQRHHAGRHRGLLHAGECQQATVVAGSCRGRPAPAAPGPRTGASRPLPPVTCALNPAAATPSTALQPTEKACVKLGVGKLREEPPRGVCRSAPVPPRRVPPCACPQPPTSPPCPQASQSSSACAASTAFSGGPTAPCSRWVLRGALLATQILVLQGLGGGTGGARPAAQLACPHPGGCAAEQLGAPEACAHPGASRSLCFHLAACCRRRARRSGTLRRPRRAPAATPSSAPPPALQPAPSPSSRWVLLSLVPPAGAWVLAGGRLGVVCPYSLHRLDPMVLSTTTAPCSSINRRADLHSLVPYQPWLRAVCRRLWQRQHGGSRRGSGSHRPAAVGTLCGGPHASGSDGGIAAFPAPRAAGFKADSGSRRSRQLPPSLPGRHAAGGGTLAAQAQAAGGRF